MIKTLFIQAAFSYSNVTIREFVILQQVTEH